MQDYVVAAARMTLGYAKANLEDIPDAQFCHLPPGIANHPAWILGHLVICGEASLAALGLAPKVPPAWHQVFAFGKPATPDRAAYPGKAELLEAYVGQTEKVIAALCRAKPTALTLPLEDPMMKSLFPNVGSLVVCGLTVHPAIHFGQLSVWRQAQGLPLPI